MDQLPELHLKEEDAYDVNKAREVYLEECKAKGLKIVLPASNELQVDLDTEAHCQTFFEQIAVLQREYPETSFLLKPSKNGLPGRHATVTIPWEVGDWERIAFQAALGSDPMRELLSAIRLLRGDIHPTLFVERESI